MTPEAKQLLIEDTCSIRTAVTGGDGISRVITAFNYRSVTPSQYIPEETSAIAWLTDETVAESPTVSGRLFSMEMKQGTVVR